VSYVLTCTDLEYKDWEINFNTSQLKLLLPHGGFVLRIPGFPCLLRRVVWWLVINVSEDLPHEDGFSTVLGFDSRRGLGIFP
jgi:hypothetical protein